MGKRKRTNEPESDLTTKSVKLGSDVLKTVTTKVIQDRFGSASVVLAKPLVDQAVNVGGSFLLKKITSGFKISDFINELSTLDPNVTLGNIKVTLDIVLEQMLRDTNKISELKVLAHQHTHRKLGSAKVNTYFTSYATACMVDNIKQYTVNGGESEFQRFKRSLSEYLADKHNFKHGFCIELYDKFIRSRLVAYCESQPSSNSEEATVESAAATTA